MSTPYDDENGQFSYRAVRDIYELYRHPDDVDGPGTGHGGWQPTAAMLRLGPRESICGICDLVVPTAVGCDCT